MITRKLMKEDYPIIDLMVWEFNESALELYKSLGMKPQRYILEKEL